MRNVLFLLCALFSLISCNKSETESNDSIYGFWKQENSEKYILEFKTNSNLIFYTPFVNEKYVVEGTKKYKIISNTNIVIDGKNLFYKIEKGKLSIYDDNKDVHYDYPFVRCDEPDTLISTIPNLPVNLQLRLEGLDYDLNANLACKTFTQPRFANDQLGFGGILVINGIGENPVNLYAYDLACPVEAKSDIRVVPDKSGITATCPKCGAIFSIATGTGAPQSGTEYYLKSYRVIGNGTQYTVVN